MSRIPAAVNTIGAVKMVRSSRSGYQAVQEDQHDKNGNDDHGLLQKSGGRRSSASFSFFNDLYGLFMGHGGFVDPLADKRVIHVRQRHPG